MDVVEKLKANRAISYEKAEAFLGREFSEHEKALYKLGWNDGFVCAKEELLAAINPHPEK